MANKTERRGRGYRSRLLPSEQKALDTLARERGYEDIRVEGQPTIRAGVGFVLSILSGEVATVMLDSDQRWEVIAALRAYANQRDDWMSETIRDVADQLAATARREEELDQEELREYMRDE